MIEHLIAIGGAINISGGFLKTAHDFAVDGEKFAGLSWETAPPGRAFFDVAESRYSIFIRRPSRLAFKGSIHVESGGNEVAVLRVCEPQLECCQRIVRAEFQNSLKIFYSFRILLQTIVIEP